MEESQSKIIQRLRRAIDRYERARVARDQAIVDAVKAGMSYREIEAATEVFPRGAGRLSFNRVAQLVKEARDA
jgi:transposase-like protein